MEGKGRAGLRGKNDRRGLNPRTDRCPPTLFRILTKAAAAEWCWNMKQREREMGDRTGVERERERGGADILGGFCI